MVSLVIVLIRELHGNADRGDTAVIDFRFYFDYGSNEES